MGIQNGQEPNQPPAAIGTPQSSHPTPESIDPLQHSKFLDVLKASISRDPTALASPYLSIEYLRKRFYQYLSGLDLGPQRRDQVADRTPPKTRRVCCQGQRIAPPLKRPKQLVAEVMLFGPSP